MARHSRSRKAGFAAGSRLCLIGFCLLASACSMTGERPQPNTELLGEMEDILERGERAQTNVLDEQSAKQAMGELIPGLSISDEILQPVEERFNIAANQEDARQFFSNLVAGTQYGVLVSPEIEGQISISLPNVTIDEVMGAVEEAYDYSITRRGNIYQIQPPTLQTRMFTIDYLDVQRTGSSRVQVSSGGQISTATDTDFWTDITETLESMLESGDSEQDAGKSVIVQPQIGLVMVTGFPKDLARVAEYIERAQGILSREVTIQVQFLEVVLNKGFQSAIDFDTFGPGGETGTDNTIVADFQSGGDSTQQSISNPLAITTNFTDFASVFRLLDSRGTTQVLSSPSLKVLNNQKAVFQDGDQEYFQVSTGSSVVSSGQAVTQSENNDLEQFFSGISMDITPQISSDGSITLHVHPTITTVTEQTKPIGGQQVPLARTSVRELDSIISAQDGKIVVLGGLAYEREVDEASGIPFAADLPAVGAAFDQRRRSTVKSEFIILLRPVIASPHSEQQLLRERSTRLNEINRSLDPFSVR